MFEKSIRLNLSLPSKAMERLRLKADSFGLLPAIYVKHLIYKDIEKVEKTSIETDASSQRVTIKTNPLFVNL